MTRRLPRSPARRPKRARSKAPAVDLARERRIRDRLDELRALLDGGEVDRARTLAALAGTLEAPGMTPDVPTSLRLPAELLARVDALAELLAADPRLSAAVGGRVSRSAILRVALERGVAALEADAAPSPGRGPVDVAAELADIRARLDALAAAVRS